VEINDYKFQKLTPIHDANLNIYKDALDFVFANGDIKNVGILGAYSAGKSSVIESYKAIHPEKRFLHISLAYFESADTIEAKNGELESEHTKTFQNVIEENVLEGKILNQLIHQIDTAKIPQTNFRVKRHVSRFKTILVSLGVLLFICMFAYLFSFNSWKQYIGGLSVLWIKNYLMWTTNSACLLFCAIILAGLLTLLVYNIIQLQKNKSLFKKLSVQGNEIEIFEQNDNSYFDKYLNEVLYLFENSEADVIVFEDMDRYNTNQIFQRLREINTLINNRREKKNNRYFNRLIPFQSRKNKPPLRFFYLLRDDIFISKDRTKFFDFIVPIVPVLDGSNSYNQFIKLFKVGELFELFDENFLQGISLYVDDMRILKNIYNEYIVYNERIGTIEQNANKLLAIIVYKNIFPRDFSDLQLSKGFVFNLFSKRNDFIEDEKQKYENNIAKLEDEIDLINNETLESERELDTLYNNEPYTYYRGRTTPQYISERDARKQKIKQRTDGSIEKMKEEIVLIKQKKETLQNKKLCEIINKNNIDDIFQSEYTNEIGQTNHFNEIKSSEYFDLLKYLIRNGFIDETYPDYMTYFYENSLSRIDKVFLRSVTDEKAKEYTYALKNPEMVVRRLRLVDFDKEETLNFDLFIYLLKTQSRYSAQLNRFMLQLKNNKNLDFIEQFFVSGKEIKYFINYVNHHWSQLFINIIQESNFNDSQKKEFALASIYFSPNNDLSEMNLENVLSEFVANRVDFLQIDKPNIKRIIEVFEFLQIKFIYIEYKISDFELWSAVYSHNLYEINSQMIESILENQYHIPQSDDYNHKNFSLILSKPTEPLVAYVKDNMEQYMDMNLTHCNSSITDHEQAATYIINDETVSDGHKESYIDLLKTHLTLLCNIEEAKWWTPLIQHNLIIYSIDNVLFYFFGMNKTLDSTIVNFINEQGKEFNFSYKATDEEFGENSEATFFDAVVKCNTLQNDKYKTILQFLDRHCESFSVQGISKNKIDILIELQTICMSPDTLLFMRENYKDNVLYFIHVNIQKYVEEVINESNFSIDEALEVLKLDIEDVYKIHLLKFTDEPISIVDKNHSPAVETYILENNFDINDLSYLLQHYDVLDGITKEAIEKVAVHYIDNIILNKYAVPYAFALKLLSNQSLDISDKLKLFAFVLPSLKSTQCKSLLEEMHLDSYLSLFEGKRPKFKVNGMNESILNIFEKKGWITKFEADEDNNYYRAFGRKQQTDKTI
jgi:hypothetical protein